MDIRFPITLRQVRNWVLMMFRGHHFQVYVVNEDRTSKTCPHCANDLETFHRREGESFIVHGLLRCQRECCQLPMNKNRLWNRNDVATLNIRAIMMWLR